MDPTGNVTAVQVRLNGETTARSSASQVDFSAIGQIFGSAIGRAIAGNDNQFKTLAVGTVAGLVGQKFVQALINGPGALDLSKLDIADIFNGQDVSLAGAGLGAAASFLTAEIATSIGLEGVGAQMFNAAVGGYLGSVLNQVRQQGFNVLTATIKWDAALHASEVSISSALGSSLAHQFVHAESQYGAVGGQLAGAIGSALAYSFSVTLGTALNVFLPGVGAFFGTIIGTMLGDAIAGDPAYPKAFHDVRILGSDQHFTNRLVGTDDHGNASVSEAMGDQVTKIANSYLDAVHGAAIAYSGKVMIGYNAGAGPHQYIAGWFPNGTEEAPHFASATDAIQQGVRELLVNTEVFGGDLLIKRAHQAFINGPHSAPTETASDFTDLASLGGDIRTAQDYQQYLNDRETINALIQLYPESAFTAGWAATFARVNDLGLNHVQPSDFIGGLVGWLDSVNKAGLGFAAANASVKHGSGSSIVVEVRVDHGMEVPGALSVFADHTNEFSDAAGRTVQFVFDGGLTPLVFHTLDATATEGNTGNDVWFGPDGVGTTFTSTGGHDVLIGGVNNDVIFARGGWDFVDGGAGIDYLFGEDGSDILRGGRSFDFLYGGQGDDTYGFNRGDGVDRILDDHSGSVFVPDLYGTPGSGHYEDRQLDAGADTLAFGAGISPGDIRLQLSGAHLIVGVKDPAHPGVPFGQLADNITLENWTNPLNRVEFLRFADGTTLNIAAALGSYQVPFGATLSRSSVVEKSPIGTPVGTVTGFDFNPDAVLTYSLENDSGGRFAINASTGVVTVAAAIDYDAGHSWDIAVRVSDGAHVGGRAFTINVIDVPNRAPVLSVPAAGITANAGKSLQVSSWFSASDADGDALTYYFQDGTAAANSGYFVLNGTAYAQGANFGISAAQLAQLTFMTGAEGASDDLQMQLSDGRAVSALGTIHIDAYKVGFTPVTTVLAAFNPANGWTSNDHYPRVLADVNGDGMADIIGFGIGGVMVSLATGGGHFASPQVKLIGAFNEANGWSSDAAFHRELADVNGDGMADIVGFGIAGVRVALATGGGNFAAPEVKLSAFNAANGWTSQDQFPRHLADVNGDGMADIIGFGNAGVLVALATGGGNFAAPQVKLAAFNAANGWTSQDQFPRQLADINGDHMADIVGFGHAGVLEALASGGGNFTGLSVSLAAFNQANGWASQDQFPRQMADVNGDGMADIIGFGNAGVLVALATGGGHFAAPAVDLAAFNPANGWSSDDAFLRAVADVTGDGFADIVGFGNAGVLEALANGFHLV